MMIKLQSTFGLWVLKGKLFPNLFPEFEKQNPNIKVKVLQMSWIAAHEKLITAFAGETLPDVFQLGNTWIPEFESLGSIEPLNSYIKNLRL